MTETKGIRDQELSEQKLLKDAHDKDVAKSQERVFHEKLTEEEVAKAKERVLDPNNDEDIEIKSRKIEAEWKPPFSGDQDTITLRRRIGIIERIKIFFTGYSKAESRVRFLYSEFANGYGIIHAKYGATNDARITIEQGLADNLEYARERNESLHKELGETKRLNGQSGVKIRIYEDKLRTSDESYSSLKDLYDQQFLDIQDLARIDKMRKETALAKRNATILQKKLAAAENLVEEKEEHIRVLRVEVSESNANEIRKKVDEYKDEDTDLSEKADTDLSS